MPDETPRRFFHPRSTGEGARQEDREGADINRIVARYRRSGTLPAFNPRTPYYGDFTALGDDLQAVTEHFQDMEDRFMQFPSSVRKVCDNDWRKLPELASTPEGLAALQAAGMELEVPESPPAQEPSAPAPENASPPEGGEPQAGDPPAQ